MISVTKEMLNKKLERIMSIVYGDVVVDYDMISAKWVDVREDRSCYDCGSKIPKGTTALTSSRRNEYGDKFRVHRCYLCGESTINQMIRDNTDLRNEEMHDEAFSECFGPLGLGQD